jgi:RNA polymerase sigma-70 factor (subfamily 1)
VRVASSRAGGAAGDASNPFGSKTERNRNRTRNRQNFRIFAQRVIAIGIDDAYDGPDLVRANMTSQQWQTRLASARAGSDSALGQILDGFRPYLWIIARGELGPELQAKVGGSDVVQESLLNACNAFERFQGDTPEEMQAWLRKILLRVVSHRRREFAGTDRRAVEREVPLDASDSRRRLKRQLSDKGETPSQRAMSAEQRHALERALRELPDHYRQVIRLRSEEQRPFEEIAKALGQTPDGARMLWGRAIRKLQTFLNVKS